MGQLFYFYFHKISRAIFAFFLTLLLATREIYTHVYTPVEQNVITRSQGIVYIWATPISLFGEKHPMMRDPICIYRDTYVCFVRADGTGASKRISPSYLILTWTSWNHNIAIKEKPLNSSGTLYIYLTRLLLTLSFSLVQIKVYNVINQNNISIKSRNTDYARREQIAYPL